MFRTAVKAASVIAAAALATVVAAGSGAAGAAPTRSADAGSPMDAAVSAYLKVYPQMSREAATVAAEGQLARKGLYEDLTADGGKAFGGAWYDPPTNVLHVATTSSDQATKAVAAGRQRGLTVETHLVARSYAQLERMADGVRKGTDALGRAARGQVGIDVRTNRVVVAVPAKQVASLAGPGNDGITVVADKNVATEADAGCTTRNACDWTVRAGSMLWRGNQGFVCSVGFTARTTTNVRYTYTAGHCSNGNGVQWGTGALPIGPMAASRDSGAVDAAIIQVTNSWFTGDLGGEIYNSVEADRSVDVDYVAPTLSYLWSGDTVCLAANYTDPAGPSYCGVLGTNSDWWVRGMARVDGLDACGGDSGGGWYWLASATYRVAYGIHSRSDGGCHGDSGGDNSWFSPLPTVKSDFAPGLNVETR